MKDRLHLKIIEHQDKLNAWYESRLRGGYEPFYASFDIRDSGSKIGNIDGNVFPAGFNNICQADKDTAPEAIKEHLSSKFPQAKNLLLLTEDHLKNIYYWENVIAIRDLLQDAGYPVEIGMLSEAIEDGQVLESFSGKTVSVSRVFSHQGQLQTAQQKPDLVICNNDFSNSYPDIDFSQTLMTPKRALGWFQRKKHRYFDFYNQMAGEFAEILGESPCLMQVLTERFEAFDVSSEASRNQLAEKVDDMLSRLRQRYEQCEIDYEPFIFVKNNSGTYGLGVTKVSSGQEVREWTYKSKKKMKATKGGGGVSEVIIQEGVPSALKEDQATAEPVLYMVGRELVGGFLRTHSQKDSQESLNSPGAVYKRLCLSDLKVDPEGKVLENVYGWIAKLGYLAICQEAQELK